MPLSSQQTEEITGLLTDRIRRKLTTRKVESTKMPFHTRLLGKDRMAVFSFVQSINTTVGQNVFEEIAVAIARPHYKQSVRQYNKFDQTVTNQAHRLVETFVEDLATGHTAPDKDNETRQILAVAQSGGMRKIESSLPDLFLESHDGDEYYFEIKTAKPNKSGFKEFKRLLLNWIAMRGRVNPQAKIHTILAIPYNPYEPKPYDRLTLRKLFDLKNEVLVAEEFWNFLGGENTYEDLLSVFEQVGIALRPEIDAKFAKLN